MAGGKSTFTGPGGKDPYVRVLEIQTAVMPTAGDGLWAAKFLEDKIIRRTASGVDVDGQPFAPLSERYGKRKYKRLGHANADLFGYKHHPHMMTRMEARSGSHVSKHGDQAPDASTATEPGPRFELGFYGEEAVRAATHNEGSKKRSIPKRHFFGANAEDQRQMIGGMGRRQMLRVKAGAR